MPKDKMLKQEGVCGGAICDAHLGQTSDLQLDDSQLKKFLHLMGVPKLLVTYFNELPTKFSSPVRSILDCGGGNGMCLDMLCFLSVSRKLKEHSSILHNSCSTRIRRIPENDWCWRISKICHRCSIPVKNST